MPQKKDTSMFRACGFGLLCVCDEFLDAKKSGKRTDGLKVS